MPAPGFVQECRRPKSPEKNRHVEVEVEVEVWIEVEVWVEVQVELQVGS
jgi:hypothetical protein